MVKKQLFRSGIALLAVLFALVFAGCDSDTDDTEKSDNTRLMSIKIGSAEESFWTDHPAESVAAITVWGHLKLSNSDKDNAAVTLTPVGGFLGKIEIAKVGKGGGASAQFAPYAAGTTKFVLAHEEEIYIKMIAEDGKTIRYYGVIIEIGTDAGLKSITVGNEAFEEGDFGTPASTLAGVESGAIMMTQYQPAAGFVVVVTPNDADAKVSFGKGEDDSGWAEGKQQTIIFEDEDILGVKVVSGNGQTTSYYKIKVELMPVMEIPYGTPSLGTGDFVHPLWNDIDWINIKKQNRAESTQEFYDDPSTSGKAKLFWDAEGLWLYVDVDGPLSTNTGYAHEGSSVELFINEAYSAGITTGNHSNTGGQYRLDSNGVTSGDPSAAVSKMDELNKFKAFKKTDGTGYFVMFQAPWRFASTYHLTDDKKISLEIQINAANRSGTGRIGVLKWYNTTANTYQNASALAEGILKLNGQKLPTQPPGITTQPQGYRIPLNTAITPLTVEAVSPEGGQLTYQWYTATNGSGAGAAIITGATSPSYTPNVPNTATGAYFYYVVVTNTNEGDSKSTNSNVVQVRIYDPNLEAPNIDVVFTADMLGGNGEPSVVDGGAGYTYTTTGYGQSASFMIDLGSFTMADYSKISFTINSEGGDPNYKACFVNGSTTTSLGLSNDSDNNVTTYTGSPQNVLTAHPVDLEFSIDKEKAINSALTGEIYLAVFINSSGCTYTVTNFKILTE
jgi:hypothetical protein